MVQYGHGDGGGGATRMHLERLNREKDLEGMPKVEQCFPTEYFSHIRQYYTVGKTFVGELYFAAHRGTYTSQARIKKLNRKSEIALREAELFAVLIGVNIKEKTDTLWKKVLFNQFHDIIPGSSITAVCELAEKDYASVLSELDRISDGIFGSVVQEIPDTLTLFNSLPWDRKILVELPEGYTSVEDRQTQMIGGKTIALLEVPSCGYKAFRLSREPATPAQDGKDLALENEYLRAEFNAHGEMVSLICKENGFECLERPSNIFRMYQDMPTQFDAWDIDSFYEEVEVNLPRNAECTPEYSAELYSSLVIKKRVHNSEIWQRVILRKGSRRIDFETEVDWNETHKLLKVDINTNVHTEDLVSEIQFGNIKRPNHKNRPYDADRFEVPQHKWSALNESSRGVAVLNDCKYGISADGGRMSLTLLKSATAPALYADKGHHSFVYSIMPYSGSFRDSRVVQEAYELNYPVAIKQGFAEEKSLIRVSEESVIVETVKPAEDGSGNIILRLYECHGGLSKAKVLFGFDVKTAFVNNMLEENQKELPVQDNTLELTFKAFEIVTLRVKLVGKDGK